MKGFSISRPSFFSKQDYTCWKIRMTWFLKSIDFDLWEAIQTKYQVPKNWNEVSIPKPSHEWDEIKKGNTKLNTKGICYLHYALDKNEENRIS